MSIKPTTTKEIENIIKALKSNNWKGWWNFIKVLNLSSPFISSPWYICNKTFWTNIFPDRLKYSIIKPLYTTG
jgi:hypothetical protein